MTEKSPMTLSGAERLKAELEFLIREERPRITKAIAEARAHGDLKENAEYHAAKDQQGLTEAKIRDLESQLNHCHIIDVTTMNNDGKVIFGSTVKLVNVDTEEAITYQIVGIHEADIKQGKISYQSPIAKAIIAKFQGQEIEVQTPSGTICYEIELVQYI
jgi:transcription elongation factor GreA